MQAKYRGFFIFIFIWYFYFFYLVFLTGSSACLEVLFCLSSSFHGSTLLLSDVFIVLCMPITLVLLCLLSMAKSFCATDSPLLFFHFPGSPFQFFDLLFSWWLIFLLKSSALVSRSGQGSPLHTLHLMLGLTQTPEAELKMKFKFSLYWCSV